MARFAPRLLVVTTREQAVRELERLSVDVCGIGMMAPKMVTRCIKVPRLECRQANILKQEMLSLGGDAAVARGTVACSIEKTDCILIGTDKQLQQLCRKLAIQPFGLSMLADELAVLLTDISQPPRCWHTSRREFSLQRPLIMGILNLTPDSFSDGGRFIEPERALEHALQMEADGADIIDIGGESTRPGAPPVKADQELSRIIPVIEQLSGRVSCAISVDTWKSAVARIAVESGAEIINDISGLNFDPEMAAVAARSKAGVVLMHTRGNPREMQKDTSYDDLMGEISEGLRGSVASALAAGITPERIAVDPGIGFGKSSDGNLEIIRRLAELSSLGLPILVGTSRKSFIGKTLGRGPTADRLHGTAATVAYSVANGASILRVHDVRAMRDTADMIHAIMQH